MIETKDLIEFAKDNALKCQAWQWKKKELHFEIVAKLEELEELKSYLHKDVLDEIKRLKKKSGQKGR